jgi:hypothetical protein
MTDTPRRASYGNQPSEQPAPGQASVKPTEEGEEVTPMYVTDNPSVYGEPPKEPEKEDKK